ncbi:hypothetical protein BKA80DRAFT_261491 [Phyllosticta citrichinensis]
MPSPCLRLLHHHVAPPPPTSATCLQSSQSPRGYSPPIISFLTTHSTRRQGWSSPIS